ncbi:hypothetical protein V7183_21640 [Bacillus sp. JJ1127]|uniref:hypothetical protein n=1 Tax=Bacillus sp. JJ1127 TaxID=3122952 RepID=UPI002FFDC679
MKWGIEAIRNTELDRIDSYRNISFGEGYESTGWTYISLSYLQNFLETSGLSRDVIIELLPINFKGIIWSSLEDEDFEFICALTDPKRCLEILDIYNLIDAAAAYTPNMEFKLRWLKERWEKGYYIFANC